jgi:ComF family protein
MIAVQIPVLHTLPRAFYPFYDFVFSPTCFHCGRRLPWGARFLCRECWTAIPEISANDTLLSETRQKLCNESCITDVVSLFRFEKGRELQSLLHELKYGGKSKVGLLAGMLLGERIRSMGSMERILGCVPVPLHPAKLRERGYNQSELLCQGIREASGLPLLHTLLRRVRHTKSQTSLSATDRTLNVCGAFAFEPRGRTRISGKAILLVDDVITTGATIRECASVLHEAGVAHIIACCAAIASLDPVNAGFLDSGLHS